METIIAALISAASAITVCIITQNRQALKMEAQIDKHPGVLEIADDGQRLALHCGDENLHVAAALHAVQRRRDVTSITFTWLRS